MNRRYAITSSVKTYCNCPCRWRYFSSQFPFSFTLFHFYIGGVENATKWGHVKWCLLRMLNRSSFIKNNLFKRVLTAIIRQSQIHQMLLFLTAAELQDKPIKSFVQALRRLPQKNYNCHYLLTCGVFAVDLYVYLWLRRGGGEGGIVHVQNV